jgi:hypothetical protein
LMFHVGGCCKMLDLRVRVESKLLSKRPEFTPWPKNNNNKKSRTPTASQRG